MITLQKTTIADLKIVQELNNELFEYEMDNHYDTYIKNWALGSEAKDYFSDLIQNQFVVLAKYNDKIVGYLAGSIYKDETFSYYNGITAEMNNMFIKKEYRNFGIGTKMVNIKFYEKMGFENINITLRKELEK